jgi:hypothetical protein
MNYKLIFSSLIAILFTFYSATAQQNSSVSTKELSVLIGTWQGTLNYSGTITRKPYTTTAELVIKQIGTSNKFELLHVYTKDPNDNTRDTISISENGTAINGVLIKSKRTMSNGNIVIVTEAKGFDRDNNKAAFIRHTYTIGKQNYQYKKEVQPEGQTDWLERQEFNYARKSSAVRKAKTCSPSSRRA